MKNNVVELFKNKKIPHDQGCARCLNCQHEWQVVIPSNRPMQMFECPSCSCFKGMFKYEFVRDNMCFVCHCGNSYFTISEGRCYCPHCGKEATV